MKENKAPEKIYRTTTYLDNDKGKTLWKKAPVVGAENIEYTRTDAFIEKAAEWMFSQASIYSVTHVSNDGSIYTYFYADKMVEDFRNYMKGE